MPTVEGLVAAKGSSHRTRVWITDDLVVRASFATCVSA